MKRAIIELPATFLHFAFIERTDYHVKVEHGLPDDAKFCACHYDHTRHVFQLIYESETFEDISEGLKMPILDQITANFVACNMIETNELIPQYE
ncbi:hypothetical protein LCGC14_0717770 [marine sediment metagenome]|uniref:Uncharacterized protein n=1 Tax=marine sediment metagenome TaxID=412755 RepID=A0A0F9TKP2_9ZZZZ